MALLAASPLRDIRTLPYPKERIKQALLVAIRHMPTDADRERLRSGYGMLGNWRDVNETDPMAASITEGKALLAELRAAGCWTLILRHAEGSTMRAGAVA
jgi:hypothetical protein